MASRTSGVKADDVQRSFVSMGAAALVVRARVRAHDARQQAQRRQTW
jgi:hypothetical protein